MPDNPIAQIRSEGLHCNGQPDNPSVAGHQALRGVQAACEPHRLTTLGLRARVTHPVVSSWTPCHHSKPTDLSLTHRTVGNRSRAAQHGQEFYPPDGTCNRSKSSKNLG